MDSSINRIKGVEMAQRVNDTQRTNTRQVAKRATSAYESQRLEKANNASAVASAGAEKAKVDMTLKVGDAAELKISDAGRQMAADMVAEVRRTTAQTVQPTSTKVTNVTEARAAIARVGEAVARKPEMGTDLHSNLRTMRVNQLIFE